MRLVLVLLLLLDCGCDAGQRAGNGRIDKDGFGDCESS